MRAIFLIVFILVAIIAALITWWLAWQFWAITTIQLPTI